MEETCLLRIIWFGLSSALLAFSFTNIINVFDTKFDCTISNITYPTSFLSDGWKSCSCHTEFCTDTCYCVNLYSNQGRHLFINNVPQQCSIESNIIPYNLNFSNIVSTFQDKTVNCWYDTNKDILYINDSNFKNNVKYTCFVIFCLLTVACVSVEIVNVCLKNKNTLPPEYQELEVPPEYQEEA